MAVKEKTKENGQDWVAEDIKAGELKHVYLIYGEETERKRIACKRLLKALNLTDDTMNLQTYEGRGADTDKIIAAADTMPFFAAHRAVLIKDSGLYKTKQDELADYIGRIPKTAYLIFVEREVDRTMKLYKRTEKYGRAVAYGMLTGEALAGEVARRIGRAGYKIRRSTMDYLLEQTGADLTRIQNELDKLTAYAAGREEITKEDVDAVVTNITERESYMLTGAIANRDRAAAMRYYYELLSMKAAEPVGIIVQTANLFSLLLQIKELRLKGEDNHAIAAKLRLNPNRLIFLNKQAAKRSLAELAAVVADCVRAQEDIIQRGYNDRVAVELLILKHTAA